MTKKYNELLNILIKMYLNKNKLFVAGNGGSAADCQHLCGQLLKGFNLKRSLSQEDKDKIISIDKNGQNIANTLQYGLPVISLLSHISFLTAYVNDVNFQNIFAQQLYVLGNAGDCVIGFSTSGNSKNIKNLFIVAKSKNIKTILFTGNKKGQCHDFADLIIDMPSNKTYQIQQYHLKLYHKLCLDLQNYFFGDNTNA